MQALRELIDYHTERYFVHDDPEFSDAVDALRAQLRELEAAHPISSR